MDYATFWILNSDEEAPKNEVKDRLKPRSAYVTTLAAEFEFNDSARPQ